MEYTYIRNVPLFIQSLNLNIFHFYLLDLVTLAIHPLWIHLPICLWEGSEQWKEKPSFMERWEYWGTYPTKCWHVHTWKDFNLKWNQRIWNGYSHRHPQKKLKAYILISIKCLIYRRPRLSLGPWLSAKALLPPWSQWMYCLDSDWTSPSLHSLPINTAPPFKD